MGACLSERHTVLEIWLLNGIQLKLTYSTDIVVVWKDQVSQQIVANDIITWQHGLFSGIIITGN